MEERKINICDTEQRIICGDARNMEFIADDSTNLIITSPPYFNVKDYSVDITEDLGNIDDLDEWYEEMYVVWKECYRVLQPGRKMFINTMNVPIKNNKSFRTLNIVGKTIDDCIDIGFTFKRDIIWHKTHGAFAHFGTYPYPGSILLNMMHEYILEFEKPAKSGYKKYEHVSKEDKEKSKLEKDFWILLKKSDVWSFNPANGPERVHIAPFPLELPRRLILAYSYVGEVILDPFAGSCTTLIAAAENKRNGIGVEINIDIINAAIKRLEELR